MTNKVKSPFIDKLTRKRYKKGDSYSHEDDERIAFLIERGFLEEKVSTRKKTVNKDAE